jgi:CRP-like cAMP-binding protein
MTKSFAPESIATAQWRRSLEENYHGRGLHTFGRGQIIPMDSQDVWLVCRGIVQLSTVDSAGTEIFTGFVGVGMPFGKPLSDLDPYTAVTLSEVHLFRFTMAEVERSIDLSQRFLAQISRRVRQSEALLALVSQKRIEERLKQFLLLLKQEAGQSIEGGVRLNVRLTHQHIANAINSTRVTVTKVIKQLQQEGWLKLDKDRYLIICEP